MILIKANFSNGTVKYVARNNCAFHPINGSILNIDSSVEFTTDKSEAKDFQDSVRADNWINHFHKETIKGIDFFDSAWSND